MQLLVRRVHRWFSSHYELLAFTVIVTVMLVIVIAAQPTVPKTVTLSEVEFLRLENLAYKQQMAVNMANTVHAEFDAAVNKTCKEHGIAKCEFNIQAKTVTEVK